VLQNLNREAGSDPDLTPPTPSGGDRVHSVVRAALGAIPVVGSAASELFVAMVQPPLDRRRSEWMEDVGEALSGMLSDGALDEARLRDDRFVDAAVHATRAAIATSSEEKRLALRAAVLNSVLPGAPDAAEQHMFIRAVDEMTEWHLRILRLFQDPAAGLAEAGASVDNIQMGSLSTVLVRTYPNLGNRRDLFDQIWADVRSRGFVNTDGLHTTMSSRGMLARRTTPLGDRFLSFVTLRGSP